MYGASRNHLLLLIIIEGNYVDDDWILDVEMATEKAFLIPNGKVSLNVKEQYIIVFLSLGVFFGRSLECSHM